MSRILVTGATGNLGAATVDFLLKRTDAANIVALVRDADNEKAQALKAKGVEVRTGDYNNYPSLVNAFKGIDKLYFVSGNDLEHRLEQHENVVKAAVEAKLKLVVYTSVPRKNESATSPIFPLLDSHVKTESLLIASRIPYTILKHNLYMEMLPAFLGEQLLQTGVAYFPAGEGKVSFTSRMDMAEAAAALLTTEGHENKVYDMTNNKTVSFPEIAAEISKISGKAISYVSPSQEEYRSTLLAAGVPAHYVGVFAGFAEGFKQQEFDQTNNLIETLTGRKPLREREILAQ